MNFLKTIFTLLFISCVIAAIAQPKTNIDTYQGCAIERATQAMYKTYPGLKEQMKTQLEALANQPPQLKSGSAPGDVVPVVFHIIPSPCGIDFDFSREELEIIIDRVNTNFAGQNTYDYDQGDPFYNTFAGDVELEFRLAEVDPYGNPTEGITRPTTSIFSFDGLNLQPSLKDIVQWNPSRYLNVWVVQDLDGASGVAQYPITAASQPDVDGIVMHYDYMKAGNPNGRNDILTHEIGHWLGLLHTWGDFFYPSSCPPGNVATFCICDDFINDTPNCDNQFQALDCPDKVSCNVDRNTHNFMDYGCEVMFTKDQKQRMWNTINNGIANRNQIITNDNDDSVFMDAHPQNSFAKLYMDKVVFRESDTNPGAIPETGIIEIRNCSNCSFSNNIGFTTSGLPPAISVNIVKIGNQQAQISFNVDATNPYIHQNDVENISITLNQNAIIGTSQVFNNRTIGGLKIDFRPEGLTLAGSPTGTFAANQFTAIVLPYLGISVGFTNRDAVDGSIRMYSIGHTLDAAVTFNNSPYVRRFGDNQNFSSSSFRELTGGSPDAPNNLILYHPQNHTDWLGQTGYVGIKYEHCQTYYAWIKIEVTATNVNILDAVINLDTNQPIITGEVPIDYCTPSLTTNQNGMHFTNVTLGQINQDSGNGAYESFVGTSTNLSTSSAYTLSLTKPSNNWSMYWRAWIDYNQDFDFDDPGEQILATTTANNTVSQNFTVPTGATAGATRMRVAIAYQPTNSTPDPCGENFSLGEIEDYTVIIGGAGCNVGEACNDNNVCTTNDVLDSNCNCAGTFQDTDNDGICDANDECPNDPNNNCNTQNYCSSQGAFTNYEFIQNVNVAGINNTSGDNGGYADFTAQTANVNAGSAYVIMLTPGFGSAGAYNEHWRVWIDFNKDGDFTDSGEELLSQSSNAAITSTINIPPSVSSGATRMRITMNYSSAVTSCGGFTYGEVEDYSVNIGGASCTVGAVCNDNNTCTINDVYDSNCNCAGVFQDSDNDGVCDANDECPNDPNNLCNTCTTGASCNDNNACTTNDVYDSNCNCNGTFQDADGDGVCAANDCNDNNPNIPTTPGTTCNDGDSNTNDDVIQADGCTCAGTTPTGSEYCEPTGLHPQIYISNVSLEQISNPTGLDGYGDYTNQVANLSQGESYTLSVTESTPWSFYWRGWIDYNQNNVFDANELVLSANNTSGTFQQNIVVPANAPIGTTRMRIYLKYSNGAAPDPCDNISLGEVEDYTINIQAGASSCNAAVPTASQITNAGSVYCNFAYGYCNGHTGDNKEFELTNLSTGSTSTYASNTHYAAFPGLSQGTNYRYRVRIECGNTGTYGGWSPYQNFTTPSCKLATEILNLNNFPNPFSDRTTIEFSLPNDSSVTLQVYDLTGRRVATLLDDELKIAGNHRVIFDGKAHPSGMYIYTIQAGEYTGTGKMNIMK